MCFVVFKAYISNRKTLIPTCVVKSATRGNPLFWNVYIKKGY